MKINMLMLASCMLFLGAVLGGIVVYSVDQRHTTEAVPMAGQRYYYRAKPRPRSESKVPAEQCFKEYQNNRNADCFG